jgi:hypothetical protein
MGKGNWARNKERNKRLPTPTSDGTIGYVYVFHLGMDNIYKIGHSGNVPSRLKSLAASNPKITARIASRVDNMFKREYFLHKKYKKQRVERECFRLERSDLSFIQSYLDKNKPIPFIDPTSLSE